jgi:hypothetical protein
VAGSEVVLEEVEAAAAEVVEVWVAVQVMEGALGQEAV